MSVTGRRGGVTDEQVFDHVKRGSAEAFDRLYDRFRARAWRVARSVCADSGQAEEAVQDAFLTVWRKPALYDSRRGRVAPWLLTVVRHKAIDVARREASSYARRADEHALGAIERVEDTTASAIVGDEVRQLRSLLAQLPDTQREVITLAFYGQLTHDEIAVHLDLPTGTVKGRMRLGLEKLRSHSSELGT